MARVYEGLNELMYKWSFFNLGLIITVFTMLLVGCKPDSTQKRRETSMPGAINSNSTSVDSETPAVSADKGAFHIVLMYSTNGDPVRKQNLYLAELLPLQGGVEGAYVPALDLNKAPRAESTQSGEVVISMIPPGKYALALLTPVGPILVIDFESNKEITLEINAGETTDLGIRKVILDQDFLEPTIFP